MLRKLLRGESFYAWILPGGGKTIPVLQWLTRLKEKGRRPKCLLISTELIIWNTWPDELKTFKRFKILRYDICHKHRKNKVIDLVYDDEFDIVAMTPGTFANLEREYPSMFSQFKQIVIDELTKFKDPTTNAFWGMRRMLKKNLQIEQVIGLGGTPQPNGERQLFSQFWIVSRGQCWQGDSYYDDFLYNYFRQHPKKKYQWDLLPGCSEYIDKLIAPWVFQPKASEYREMPPIIEYVYHLDVPDSVMKQYRRMAKKRVATFGGQTVISDDPATTYNKCRQIASGVVYKWDHPTDKSRGKTPIFVHNRREKLLEEVVEGVGGGHVLLLYNYVHEYERIKALFPDSMDVAKDRGTIAQWNAGKLTVATAHPASMAHGLNLQIGGNILIFFSPNPDLELWWQVIKRLHRGSIVEPVFVLYLVLPGTKDENILVSLEEKKAEQAARMAAHEGRY
jgi:hypothetical protein